MKSSSKPCVPQEGPTRDAHNLNRGRWIQAGKQTYSDILYEQQEGVAKITLNRPALCNAFRPETIDQVRDALNQARLCPKIGVVILTGMGHKAFCSGGDQKVRGDAGYCGEQGGSHLNVLDLQREIKSCPKPTIAMVNGLAIGGGHVLHLVCDLTIAARHAIFGQVGPKVGSFDGGFGVSDLVKTVGQKKGKEIWMLCRQYSAQEALEMGLVNCVVPYEELENTTLQWCHELLERSPLALRCLKAAFHAHGGGETGLQDLAGNATLLYYMTAEAQEGKQAFLEKRKADFSVFPKRS